MIMDSHIHFRIIGVDMYAAFLDNLTSPISRNIVYLMYRNNLMNNSQLPNENFHIIVKFSLKTISL
jgi:hypothetical protein